MCPNSILIIVFRRETYSAMTVKQSAHDPSRQACLPPKKRLVMREVVDVPSKTSPEPEDTVTGRLDCGLFNHGQSCWFNSTIQALKRHLESKLTSKKYSIPMARVLGHV